MVTPGDIDIKKPALIGGALALAKECQYEAGHSHQVTDLTLKLFDQLRPLHGLGDEERLWLECAALLHDIGWIKGREGHHKTARDIILQSSLLEFDQSVRLIVAMTARYHRRSLPRDSHRYFGEMDAAAKGIVQKLAALLRLADGLDRSHCKVVSDLRCEILSSQVKVLLKVKGSPRAELVYGKKKADLFEKVFAKEIVILTDKDDGSLSAPEGV